EAVVCECRSTRVSVTRSAATIREEAEDRAHRAAGAALGRQRRVLLEKRRARDVEVGPRPIAGEFLQEQPGGDSGAAPRPDGVHVGDVALEVLTVLVDARQA